MSSTNFVYFGGEPLGVPVLEELAGVGLLPKLIVCNPDRPSGRGRRLTPPPTKAWAEAHHVPVFQPDSLKDRASLAVLTETSWDLFVVVAYNHIMPKWLIDTPLHDTLNVHPSLLPALRGPSPIRTAILEDARDAIGVSIMQMDEAMDHGPIVAQQAMPIADEHWPIAGTVLDEALARMGGAMLAATIPAWTTGTAQTLEQNHEAATYTKKFDKEMGRLELDPYHLPIGDEAYQTLLKIRALDGWPGTFFMHEGKRVKIKEAELAPTGELRLLTIVPEGKSAIGFAQYFLDVTYNG